MTPRKWYIILGVIAIIGWLLFFLVAYLQYSLLERAGVFDPGGPYGPPLEDAPAEPTGAPTPTPPATYYLKGTIV